MKPKTMILMGLAIVCGLGASYMTSRLLAERSPAEETEKVEILVAIKDIPVHTQLAKPEAFFERKTVSKDSAPQDAITDLDSLRGKRVKQTLNKGYHVTSAGIYDKIGIEIPTGFHAIGVPVNLQTTAHGLATLPGSRVDLQLTIRASDVLATKTVMLLENVLVLAADIRVTPEGEIAAPAQVVTFALKQQDILKANVAMDMGTIRLIMRNRDDNTVATKREIVGIELLEKKKEPELEVAKVETPPVKQVEEKKPEIKPEPETPPAPPEPRIVKKHYDVVQGSGSGPRTVERVYYYLNLDDGRIMTAEEVDRENGGGAAGPRRPEAAPKKDRQSGEI